jgi:hypothetical protein
MTPSWPLPYTLEAPLTITLLPLAVAESLSLRA